MTDLTRTRDLLARAGEPDAADREAEAAPPRCRWNLVI